jgi:hypothetical protein
MNPRNRRRTLAAAIVVFLSLLLSACVPPFLSGGFGVSKESVPRSTGPTRGSADAPSSLPPAPAPSLTRESAAFFAAVTAFERYLAVVDEIGADGGAGADRIDPYAAPNHRSNLVVAFEGMHKEGIRTTGSVVLAGESLAGYRQYPGQRQTVRISACLDLSDTRVVDAAGVDITPQTRQDRVPYDVVLSTRESPEERFLVESSRSLPELAPC